MLVKSFPCHEGGASSVVYSPRHQLLISGGKKGDIVVVDVRQQKVMDVIKGHTLNVKSLAIDAQEDFLLSGSSEGNVKSWALPSMECKENWDDVHLKHRFVRTPGVFTSPVSTYGVMQVLLSGNHMYSCGSDGRVLRTAILH